MFLKFYALLVLVQLGRSCGGGGQSCNLPPRPAGPLLVFAATDIRDDASGAVVLARVLSRHPCVAFRENGRVGDVQGALAWLEEQRPRRDLLAVGAVLSLQDLALAVTTSIFSASNSSSEDRLVDLVLYVVRSPLMYGIDSAYAPPPDMRDAAAAATAGGSSFGGTRRLEAHGAPSPKGPAARALAAAAACASGEEAALLEALAVVSQRGRPPPPPGGGSPGGSPDTGPWATVLHRVDYCQVAGAL